MDVPLNNIKKTPTRIFHERIDKNVIENSICDLMETILVHTNEKGSVLKKKQHSVI